MKTFLKLLLVASLVFSFSYVNAETALTTGDVDPEGNNACLDITTSLRYRDTDAKTEGLVSQLQDFFISQGYLTGNPTGYFGLATFGAVKKFQSQYGFSPTGFAGPLTRAKIKEITCGGLTVYPNNPSDRSNSGSNLPKGCTPNTVFSPLTGEKCVESKTSSVRQPYISMVSGKAAGNFEIDAGSPAYISGSDLDNVNVSVGGKLATVTQKGDSYIYATMPSDLVPGQTYDLFVYRGSSGLYSNVVKVKVLSKVSSNISGSDPSTQSLIKVLSPNGGEILTKGKSARISWSGGTYPVQVGVVGENWPNDNTVVGWINVGANPNSYIDWDVERISSPVYLTSARFLTITPGKYKIVVAWGGQARECISEGGQCIYNGSYDVSDSYFTITSPDLSTIYPAKISLISPSKTRVGDQVTIYGMDFNIEKPNNIYIKNVRTGEIVTVSSATRSSVQTSFTVPSNLTIGEYALSINNNNGTTNSNLVAFWVDGVVEQPTLPTATVYPAKVTLLSPNKAKVGDQVTIYGMDFNRDTYNVVNFKNISTGQTNSYKFTTSSSVYLKFSTPSDLVFGEYALSVNNGKNTADSNSIAFWVEGVTTSSVSAKAIISSVDPYYVSPGGNLTITGSGFNTSKSNIILFRNSTTGDQFVTNAIGESATILRTFMAPSASGDYVISIDNQTGAGYSNEYRVRVQRNEASIGGSGMTASMFDSLRLVNPGLYR